ncbi:DUF262 domain-containing protein [Stenotrophomonas sp. 2MCAF14_2]|uniref:DUF262 domain-containing protein n=1 Tax=Stenotrophomonas sp. 2MCAF14_2 TaxID=3232983 RepID=UPI003F9DAB65
MRFVPTEPDIATTYARIDEGDLDLQPDFQRGEVWTVAKKQRLVDTLIRGWVMPPILVVAIEGDHRLQVLDGQQRLASIRDFINGRFAIDGRIEPRDPLILDLHGVKFDGLPEDVRRRFLRLPVRTYEVSDYRPEEPAEIFFRLNQPAVLSPAEKRNAFYGPVRDEIRHLVDLVESGISSVGTIGFSNSRMAYDDVLARVAFSLDAGSLRVKVTASAVSELYRDGSPLSEWVSVRLRQACDLFIKVYRKAANSTHGIRLNKATMYSWLIFLVRFDGKYVRGLAEFFADFEFSRGAAGGYELADDSFKKFNSFLVLFNDRASSRASDVSSVLIRDVVLWVAFCSANSGGRARKIAAEMTIREYMEIFSDYGWYDVSMCESFVMDFCDHNEWGDDLYASR